MIVDTHVHIYPPEVIRDAEKIATREPYFASLIAGAVHKWGTGGELIERMDATGVDVSWAFGFAFKDMGLCRMCNDYVASVRDAHPGRIRFMCVVPPTAPDVESEVIRAKDAGAIGVGELFPQGQNFDIDDSRQMRHLVGVCHEAGLFINFHTAEPVGHTYPGKGSTGPVEAVEFCTNHPEAWVIFSHMGGGLWAYEGMRELRRVLRQACYDISAMPFLYDTSTLLAAHAAGAGHKLLHGSDFPILDMGRYRKYLDVLCDEEKNNLTDHNQQRFLDAVRCST